MTPTVTATRPTPSAIEGARRSRSMSAVLQTLMLLVVGVAAVGGGAGLGIRYAQKTGLSVSTVVGAAAFVLGTVCVVVAVRRAWRRLSRWGRLLVLPLIVAVLAVASSVGLAVAYTQVPPTQLGDQTPADHGLPFADVTLTTTDGVRLSAWLVPSRSGAAVVLLHGAGSTRTSVLAHAAVLARNGFGVLLLDARGHGRSGGEGMDLGWFGDADVAAATAYLQQDVGLAPERIGLVGLSMGGEEAIGAAPTVAVRAVVAEGATARTAQDKDRWLPRGIAGAVQRGLDRLTYALTDVLTSAERPAPLHRAVSTATTTRFLLLTAGSEPDEARAAAVLRRAAPERVDVWSVPDAGHTAGLATDPAQWEQRVVEFLERELT